MQAIVDYSFLMAPSDAPAHQRRAKSSSRERRRQAALADDEMDLCASPPRRRQLPPRNESMQKLQEKLVGLQRRLDKIESKVILLDMQPRSDSGKFSMRPERPSRLPTIYECDDEASIDDEKIY